MLLSLLRGIGFKFWKKLAMLGSFVLFEVSVDEKSLIFKRWTR